MTSLRAIDDGGKPEMRRTHSVGSCYEQLYGLLPDVVETGGDQLIAATSTPVHPRSPQEASKFNESLESRLYALLLVQRIREQQYGKSVSDEWPISRTPVEIREAYKAKLEADAAEFRSRLEVLTPPNEEDPVVEKRFKDGQAESSNQSASPDPEGAAGLNTPSSLAIDSSPSPLSLAASPPNNTSLGKREVRPDVKKSARTHMPSGPLSFASLTALIHSFMAAVGGHKMMAVKKLLLSSVVIVLGWLSKVTHATISRVAVTFHHTPAITF